MPVFFRVLLQEKTHECAAYILYKCLFDVVDIMLSLLLLNGSDLSIGLICLNNF